MKLPEIIILPSQNYSVDQTSSFLRLMKRHAGVIHSIIKRYGWCRNDHDLSDYLQEVYLYAWKNFHKYQPREDLDFGSWLHNTALWAVCMFRRSLHRKWSEGVELFEFMALVFPDLSDEHYSEDHINSLYNSFRVLDDVEKEIIHLFLQGNDLHEIPAIMKVSLAVVHNRWRDAKAKIRKHSPRFFQGLNGNEYEKKHVPIGKPVEQCDERGNVVKKWPSLAGVAETGISIYALKRALREGIPVRGYIWRYSEN